MTEQGVIELTNVTVTYDHQMVLDGVNFSLGVGEFCYLIGKTGAGKSSFLKLLYRDIKPDNGIVKVADFDVTSLPIKKCHIFGAGLESSFRIFSYCPIVMCMRMLLLPSE